MKVGGRFLGFLWRKASKITISVGGKVVAHLTGEALEAAGRRLYDLGLVDDPEDLNKVADALQRLLRNGKSLDDMEAYRKIVDAVAFPQRALKRKFSDHGHLFGFPKKAPTHAETEAFESKLRDLLKKPETYLHGTYRNIAGSKVFFDPSTNFAVVVDANGDFVTVFRLVPRLQSVPKHPQQRVPVVTQHLLAIAAKFDKGEISADNFSSSYITEWYGVDANATPQVASALREGVLWDLFAFADLYEPEEDRAPYQFSDVQLAERVAEVLH